MSTKKKRTTIGMSKKARAAALRRIRLAITEQFHELSTVSCNDRIGDKFGTSEPPCEVSTAIDHLSDAINCLNRECGRRENSNTLGDGTR